MKIIQKIQEVIDSKVLPQGLIHVPQNGATVDEIKETEKILGRKLSQQHRELIEKWNGLHLDVINFLGCSHLSGPINSLHEDQISLYEINVDKGCICIADDPAAYLYIENRNGEILIADIKTGNIEKVASSLEDFICNYVFGERAEEFAGKEWKQELKNAGLIS